MPTFNLIAHTATLPPEVDEFEAPSMKEARSQAVIMAGELLKEAHGHFWDEGANWRIEVANEKGLVLYSIIIMGIGSAAVGLAD